jgi:transposase
MTQSSLKSVNGSALPVVSSATQVVPKAKRRLFSASYKQQILQEADACRQSGQLGALLRREGLYSSHLTTWRRQRTRGELGTKKRGKPADPQAKEVARLKRQNEQLQAKLAQAETIIQVQKKLCTLLGLPAEDPPTADNQ